jgi:exopolyphosphatase/guanosine-5'-triphosphate,3'-diphosphate pyrophosphatase
MMAQALFSNFGGGRDFEDYDVAALCSPDELRKASHWGLAMRLGQRLSGGVAASLKRSSIAIEGDTLRLTLKAADEGLYGETVERRLKTLGAAMGRAPEVVIA